MPKTWADYIKTKNHIAIGVSFEEDSGYCPSKYGVWIKCCKHR